MSREKKILSIEVEVWQRYEMFSKPLPADIIWKEERRERAMLALDTWKRINDNRDDYFDPEDKPELNTVPAKSSLLSIKDPGLKKEYRDLIKKHKLREAYYKIQSQIKRYETEYKSTATEYLVMLYSRPPKALEEISDLLEKHLVRRYLINDLMTTINSTW